MSDIKIKYRNQDNNNKYLALSKLAAFILIFIGVMLLAYTLGPIGWQYLKLRIPTQANKKLNLTNVKTNQSALYNYNAEASYIENILKEAQLQFTDQDISTNSTVEVNTQYKQPMYISIPEIDINNIKITSNVESSSKETYMEPLKYGVAHFKYTPLPGDGGNSVIYGHSTNDLYFQSRKNDPEIIFTKLKNIEIGDHIEINRDSKSLFYTVIQQKIVESTDLSILNSESSKETITLMTCYPWGTGTHRFIVLAEAVSKN
jgi:LPXTG-site transpeptidase (sortase) family protein